MNPNGIKKNDWILVTRDNGEVLLAQATKVGPWSKNPKLTVVTWNIVDHEAGATTVGKADARKCALAPADRIPKDKTVPTHPIMKNWSLGKTKRGPMMMEGHYFAVPVLFAGKKCGEIIDEGNGGGTITRFIDSRIERQFHNDCLEWCKANGANLSHMEVESEFWAWWEKERLAGIDAATYFKKQSEEMAKWLKDVPRPLTTPETMMKGAVTTDQFAATVNGENKA